MSKKYFDFGSLDRLTAMLCTGSPNAFELPTFQKLASTMTEFEAQLEKLAEELFPEVAAKMGLEGAKALMLSEPVGEFMGVQLRRSKRCQRNTLFFFDGKNLTKIELPNQWMRISLKN